MTITALPYQPSGSWWTRTRHALFTAYVNIHIRLAEREERAQFYDSVDQLKHEDAA